MSGHSKWSTIKRDKAKTDSARGAVFTKIGREIAVAVKQGGSDPAMNPRLVNILAKARANNMPNDNIQRSIKKAAGELGAVNYEEFTYEGYGPGGSAVICEILTDNKNRAASDVRHIFDRYGGSLGTTGSVSYLFDRCAVVVIAKKAGVTEDKVFEAAMEAEADDVADLGEVFTVKAQPARLNNLRQALDKSGFEIVNAAIEFVAQAAMELEPEKLGSFKKMLEKFDESDDIQEYYHNVNLPEETEE
ncbi:MAG: YebC/PmpR family DNA-binding transcriptional regulator [Firmicutes bacterium]|nr:YebC/PmpR family DNA-binding transcriptional regulator [Bacillota bacterium]